MQVLGQDTNTHRIDFTLVWARASFDHLFTFSHTHKETPTTHQQAELAASTS